MYSKDDWDRDFRRRVPPILDRYIQEMVRQIARKYNRKPNQQERDSLLDSIKYLIQPVVTDVDACDAWFRISGKDVEYARRLEPYVQEFLPYGPALAYALLGYEALSWFSFTADHLPHLDYIVARIMHDYAPQSYRVIEDMLFKGLDSITISFIRKLEGCRFVSSVLQKI
jgi:hypothetical protein